MSDKKLADAYDKAMEELVVLEAEIARLTTEARIGRLQAISIIEGKNAENEQLMEQIALRQPSAVERDMQLVMASNNKLRAMLDDALLILEVQFGKEATPGSLIYQIRKALANEETK